MSILDDFDKDGLPVTWGTVLLGWEGPGKCVQLLDLDAVHTYTEHRVVEPSETERSASAESLLAEDDSTNVSRLLRQLAAAEGSEPERELRKWQVVLLRRRLDTLPEDPLYGLLALTEFWEQFDYPADSPHVVQGRGDDSSPAAYYTKENKRHLVAEHRAWIAAQLARLRR